MDYFISLVFIALAIRTLLWHLQNWQIREYRFDRLWAHTKTTEGLINFFNLWFFKGILPRPKFTGRIFMILGILGLFYVSFFLWILNASNIFDRSSPILLAIFLERTLFLFTMIAVLLSKFPTYISREILFHKAKKIIQNSKNIITIGIAGSYGKSSTKEILAHLLTKEFGKKKVLFNPENQNNEIAIARLILKNKNFFQALSSKTNNPKPNFFICEVGAYRRGEIAKVCKFIQPQISILTGLNAQHIDLFGSQRNIQLGKFEMAENTAEKVFFNADNALLFEIFEDQKIKAQKIALSPKTLKKVSAKNNQTSFQLYGQNFILPWPGRFFVDNALLALECARELGIKRTKLPAYLRTLPPLERALTITQKNNFTVLWDTYSANPDGVMKAIEHLSTFQGQKIFIGIPLKELGQKASKVHEKIFKALRKINAEIYWSKEDFYEMGKKINGKNFHLIHSEKQQDILTLKQKLKKLKKGDVILLESKLPKSILDLFQS